VRAEHFLQRRFNAPPGFGFVGLSLLLEGSGLLRRFGDGLGPMGLLQLTGEVCNVCSLHGEAPSAMPQAI